MQLNPIFLVILPLVAILIVVLICLLIYNRTRSTGIHGSFNNHGKGEQTLAEAEITSHDGAFTSSFNNRKDGKQDFRKAKIKSGNDSSGSRR
ncbi:hypothetical protein PHAVU_007G081300 [Phaseolus vulgaris]|uniref:Uncharacterized protein n=1 Tax=Phaseolus vulgaris TaxID=3885 RepID=V7BF70_PHAVU|nr:hypothetical protein PHAVU_007G081300g [Phaseolus vulgaris]ESW15548.1 hypothetical protein PHAVU_007G081300g [Phaseolus vulgaris]